MSSDCTATSMASDTAMPRDPGVSGVSARMARPASVRSDGDGCTAAPYTSISMRRYGFESKDARTCHTSTSMSKNCAAKARDAPHWPAPVSVVSFFMPSSLL